MAGVLSWDPCGQGLLRLLQKAGFGGLAVPLGLEDGSCASVAATDVWQGSCSAGNPAQGGPRSCREPVGMGCPHPNRATACEGESKSSISFNCLPSERGCWCLSRWAVLLGKPSHSFLCCSIFPCSQRTLLSSYNSDTGDFKSRSIVKKKAETSTWFLPQR